MTTQQTTAATAVSLADDHLSLDLAPSRARFHYAWLRDNCWCDECRVAQTGERRLYTATIADDIAATDAEVSNTALRVSWNDGHTSVYDLEWLARNDYSTATFDASYPVTLWTSELPGLPRFDHDAVINDLEVQRSYLDAVREFGAALVFNTPCVDGEAARFADSIGHLRETAFERVHNVRHDPTGYNVAHTALELKPHSDFPSYHWPPSIQLLHFLVNESSGGESTLVDGWRVLEDLRSESPDAFDVLCRVPVTWQMFSEEEDTKATAPIVQLDTAGRVRTFRFSNQLALPVHAPFEDVGVFYDAYRRLGRMLDDDRYKLVFKTHSGDLLTVHGHRVLHGRLAFDASSGARHLQDVYMEFDDLMDRLNVLNGTHKPQPSNGRTSA